LPGSPGQPERRFFDLLVDGASLADQIAACLGYDDGLDSTGMIDCDLGAFALDARDQLLGRTASPMGGGRVGLYGCRICEDLGCGLYSARVVHEGARVVWRDFGWEDGRALEPVPGLGPFEFDAADYAAVLESLGATPAGQ
jgi:hypothetical protein